MATGDIDRDKTRQKLHFIRDGVRRLEEIRARGREEFLEEPILLHASERCLQTAIEAMIEIAQHVVAREGLGLPKTYREAMDLLVQAGILPAEQRETFARMVKFRNRVVHLYDEIDPEEVFSILEDHLSDFESFTSAIVRRYFAGEG